MLYFVQNEVCTYDFEVKYMEWGKGLVVVVVVVIVVVVEEETSNMQANVRKSVRDCLPSIVLFLFSLFNIIIKIIISISKLQGGIK